MIYKPFDIVIVPFPFADNFDKHKHRPALVLSSKKYIEKNSHTILAMITSAKKSDFWSDYKIKNYKNTNLRNECIVRMKLFTVDVALIKSKIGTLGKLDASQVKKSLKQALKIL